MDFSLDLENAIKNLSQTGAFLTTKSGDRVNTMSISWGFVGFFWNKPIFITGVRPQRYTNKVISQADSFTVSIPYGKLADEISICGTKSGADIDKSKIVSFADSKNVESPIVENCDMYYECKIIYRARLEKAGIPVEVLEKFYKGDEHYLYFGEIVNCYKNVG